MRLLTTKQAARMIRVHPETIKCWVRDGTLPDRRLPGKRKIVLFPSDLVGRDNRFPRTPEAA